MTNEATIKLLTKENALLAKENALLTKENAALKRRIEEQQGEIHEQKAISEALTAEVKKLQAMTFARRSESQKSISAESPESEPWRKDEKEEKKKGQKPGSKGHGRKTQFNLPTEDVVHDFPEGPPSCPNCGQPFEEIASTEDSEEIDIEVKVIRKRHKRKKCVSVCKCEKTKTIVTAPGPAKLIPKGLLSVNTWVHLLLEKFLWQRPLERTLKSLELHNLNLSKGTVTGGLQMIAPMLSPLYDAIVERARSANHWHADETRWMVFVKIDGKKNYRWWLWVFRSPDAVTYIIDPSRSRSVPDEFFKIVRDESGNVLESHGTSRGILNVDGFKSYKNLGALIIIALCWSHIRRSFLDVGKGWEQHKEWSEGWALRIGELFHLNKIRVSFKENKESPAYADAQSKLENAVSLFFEDCKTELATLEKSDPRAKPLSWAIREMEALTVFVKYPEIPMDNNEAERILRNPVIGRKNFYGSGSIWSSELTAMLFSIIETLRVNGINPKIYLTKYLTACAENESRAPPDLTPFLPWLMKEDESEASAKEATAS